MSFAFVFCLMRDLWNLSLDLTCNCQLYILMAIFHAEDTCPQFCIWQLDAFCLQLPVNCAVINTFFMCFEQGVVVYARDPSTWEVGARG